jgi:hypothetical protein
MWLLALIMVVMLLPVFYKLFKFLFLATAWLALNLLILLLSATGLFYLAVFLRFI